MRVQVHKMFCHVDIDLESSDGSDIEDADDTTSTTSWEDMSKLDPNLLLYKAAQARNLPVMLEALANKADPNWVNQDDKGMTPLMKAVDTVSGLTGQSLFLNVNSRILRTFFFIRRGGCLFDFVTFNQE